MHRMKRAIALAGGGPAVGLSLGALKRLHEEEDIRFDIYTGSSIGSWLGILWNTADPGREFETARDFFRTVFRPDADYSKFPIATIFAPDWQANTLAFLNYVSDPASYSGLVVPEMIRSAGEALFSFATDPGQWTQGNLNALILNAFMAPNPVIRFWTSAIYLSPVLGLSRVYYPGSPVLARIPFDRLYEADRPTLYHNAYNLTRREATLFSNRPEGAIRRIEPRSLVANSALPYIEDPVEIDGMQFAEGAVIDTVNFADILQRHPDIEEVWVSRLLDVSQARPPKNLLDALNNLVMLFAATVSEDDIKLFKFHIKEEQRPVRVIEIPVSMDIDYDWTWSNLDHGIAAGYEAANGVIARYRSESGHIEAKLDGAPLPDALARAAEAAPATTVAALPAPRTRPPSTGRSRKPAARSA